MNLSGESLVELVNYYKLDPESELIVIYDDISFSPGNLRIRESGSAGGHNGVKSIIKCLNTQRFMRIKVGVGEKPKDWDLADFVLGRFTKEEREHLEGAMERAAEAVCYMVVIWFHAKKSCNNSFFSAMSLAGSKKRAVQLYLSLFKRFT